MFEKNERNKSLEKYNNFGIFFVVLHAFFPPNYLLNIPAINTVYDFVRLTLLAIILLIYILNKIIISDYILILCLFRVFFLFSSVYNQRDLSYTLSLSFNLISTVLLLHLLAQINVQKLIKSLFVLFLIYMILTLFENATTFYFEDIFGLTLFSYFLGIRTAIPYTAIPAGAISLLYSLKKRGRYISIYSIAGVSLTIYLILRHQVATATLGFAIFLILIVILNSFKYFQSISIKIYLIAGLVLNYLIIFARIQDIFSFIIEDILQKKLTFTGRTYVWDAAIEIFSNHFWIGQGDYKYVYVWQLNGSVVAHSTIMSILCDGGIIGFGLFCWFLFVTYSKLDRISYSKEKSLFIAFAVMMLIVCITEMYSYLNTFYIFPVLAANIDKITNEKTGFNINKMKFDDKKTRGVKR